MRLEEVSGKLDELISQRRTGIDNIELPPVMLFVLFEPLQVDCRFFAITKQKIEAADAYGWRRVDFDLPNNASSKASKERKVESVWMNYA